MQVDNGSGQIVLLLSLKCQAFRVNTFKSKKLYASSVLDGKMIFVGSDNRNQHSERSASFRVSTTEAEECKDLQCENARPIYGARPARI